MTPIPKTQNGGKWPQILKHRTDRNWGHFPPFRVLGFGGIFRHSAIPPFRHSTVPAFRVALLSFKFSSLRCTWQRRFLVAYVKPYPPPKVKRKRVVLCDVTNLCKIMSLNNIFCEVARVSVKVIEINNNFEVNSFSIFRGNLQFSVRVQIYTLL